MSRSDRFEQILALLGQQRYMSVEALCEKLFVSPSTLRRDLAQMSRSGYLVRTRGGAAAMTSADENESIVHNQPLDFTPAQRAIAARAASFVRDGDVIFMDASRLSLCMAGFIRNRRPLTIVTNNLQLILALPEGRQNIICCSGTLNASNLSVIDQSTLSIASSFNYAAAFFSCAGLSGGMSTSRSLKTCALLTAAARQAERSYLLCTQDKVGLAAPVNVLPVSHLTAVITDSDPHRLAAAGVDVDVQVIAVQG